LPIAVGDIIAGKYRVEALIGSGGMGSVLRAKHLDLDHQVALKVLRTSRADRDTALERFAREGRALAQLKSEHVARVYDTGKLDSGEPYIVLEYLAGCTLRDMLRVAGPFSPTRAASYMLDCCEALAQAHALGIIHRDLKPGNLMVATNLDGTQTLKVLDFGIAKLAGDGLANTRREDNDTLTASTELVGTPRYMSPEQLGSGRTVDHRSDIWALGVVLYELLAGESPFGTGTVAEIHVAILRSAGVSLRATRPEIPERLDAIVARCLERDPEDRYQNVGELATALLPCCEGDAARKLESILRWQRNLGGARAPSARASVEPADTTERAHTATTWSPDVAADAQPRSRSRSGLLFAGAAATIIAAAAIWKISSAKTSTASVSAASTPVSATQTAPAVSDSAPPATARPTPSASVATNEPNVAANGRAPATTATSKAVAPASRATTAPSTANPAATAPPGRDPMEVRQWH
jgi:serine/threonine-protein kinase